MGCISEAICKDCGTRYPIRMGGGFICNDFHCDKCGELKIVKHEEDFERKCECGGNYTMDAPPRCPNCRSTNFEHDFTKFSLYD